MGNTIRYLLLSAGIFLVIVQLVFILDSLDLFEQQKDSKELEPSSFLITTIDGKPISAKVTIDQNVVGKIIGKLQEKM